MSSSTPHGFSGLLARRFGLMPALLALGLLWAGLASAQPFNDNFTNAALVSGPSGMTSGSIVGATREPGEPYSSRPYTVWYRWTAPATGMAEFDTLGTYSSSYYAYSYNYVDSALTIFTGSSLTNLTGIATNDDYYVLDAYTAFPVVASNQYYVRVEAYNYSYSSSYYYGGYFVLNWSMPGVNTNLVGANQIQFSAPAYSVAENTPGFVLVSVDYGGGANGNATVDYSTADGSAQAGVDYVARTGALTFAYGESNKVFTVPILDNAVPGSNKVFNVVLSNPGGGALLGPVSAAAVTIADDETPLYANQAGTLQFSSSPYYSNYAYYSSYYYYSANSPVVYRGTEWENSISWSMNHRSVPGVMVTVTRTNGAAGRVLVDYYTTNTLLELPFGRPAVSGYDYTPISGTLVFDDFQMSTNFIVPVTYYGSSVLVTNNAAFSVVLANPRAAPEENPVLIRPTLGLGATSVVQVVDVTSNPFQFSFYRLHYRGDEYGNNTVRLDIELPGAGGGGVSVDLDVRSYNYATGTYDLLEPGSDYAIVNGDYGNASGTITFNDRQTERWVDIQIFDDTLVEFNEDIICELWNPKGEKTVNGVKQNLSVNPLAGFATISILFDDQPAGAVDREWNPENVTYTTPPFNLAPGANGIVRVVSVQPNGKTLLGGDFTRFNTEPRNHIARINLDGSLDDSFTPGSGANSFVRAIAQYDSGSAHPNYAPQAGKILIGGGFTSYIGIQRNGLARLNPDGSLDETFAIGSGADGPVSSIALARDGRIYVAGAFTRFADRVRNGIARLNADGSLDTGFDPGFGADGAIRAVALADASQAASKLLVAGAFQAFNGVYHSRVARLDYDGSLDSAFSAGGGANADVFALAVQADGRVLIGGAFSEVDFRSRSGVARLMSSGALDLSFAPGSGTDDSVFAITLQPDGKAFLGGVFSSYNGTRRMGLARLNLDGTLDTTFLDTAYNQFAGLIKKASTDASHFVNSIALQPDGNVMIGGSFTNLGGNAAFEINDPYGPSPVWTRQDKVTRFNIARLIGTWGGVPYTNTVTSYQTNEVVDTTGASPVTNQVVTTNITLVRLLQANPAQGPGNAQFQTQDYTVDENGTRLNVTLQRVHGALGTLQATASTSDRTAMGGINYTATNAPLIWPEGNYFQQSQGYTGPEYFVVPILDNSLVQGDKTVTLRLTQPYGSLLLGGEVIPLGGALGVADATMTIGEDDVMAGVFAFSAVAYQTNENARTAVITVVRTNGSTGPVNVDYYTRPGSASPNRNYTSVAGTLTFDSGVTSQNFFVPLLDDGVADLDKTVFLMLTNTSGGATLPGGGVTASVQATLTIIDSDFPAGRVSFSVAAYTNSEASPSALITLSRMGGNAGRLTVACATTPAAGPGAAVLGADYLATNSLLVWDHLDSSPKYFYVPLLKDNTVDGWKRVRLTVSSPSILGALGSRTNADLWIADADAYGALNLSQAGYYADENGGPLSITVVRTGGAAGTVSVDYATVAETAVSGPNNGRTDYTDARGTLVLTNGQFSATFAIPVWDDLEADGDKTAQIVLSNPTNAALGPLAIALLTLLDNETVNIPAGDIDVTYNPEAQANGPVYALALQPDGRLLLAGDFTTFNHVTRNHAARLKDNGQLDSTFDVGTGPDGAIRSMILQPDGKVLVGGQFAVFNQTNRAGVARLGIDGSIDSSFDPGAGADGPVSSMALLPDGRILLGGSFGKFNTLPSPAIARLTSSGALDPLFATGSGPNGAVQAVAVQEDGKVLIGGDFTQVNGHDAKGLARLNTDGSVDTSFNPGAGPNGSVRTLAVQYDGRILVGGSFSTFNGAVAGRLARLNRDGSLDATFMAGQSGADGGIYTLLLQSDSRILVAGDFNTFNGVTRNRLTRLNSDGSTDVTINFGNGANSFVAALAVQPDRKIIVGGGFTTFNDSPRLYLARINGGAITGSGALDFTAPLYTAGETSSNALVWLRRTGGTEGEVKVDCITLDGSAQPGLDYITTTRTVTFPPGETRVSCSVPVVNRPGVQGDRDFYVMLDTFQGASSGWQPFATVRIQDEDSQIGFLLDNFTVSKDVYTGQATIGIIRQGATNSTVSVQFGTADDTATAGVHYVPTNTTVTFRPGETLRYVNVGVLTSTNFTGPLKVLLALSAPVPAATVSLGQAAATLTILDTRLLPGSLSFEAPEYVIRQDAGSVTLTVVRTNGISGVVWVEFTTFDGTAIAGRDFRGTNGVLVFADGEVRRSVSIPVFPTASYQGDRVFRVALSRPQGGAGLLYPTNTVVTIREDRDPPAAIRFANLNYLANESDGFASITVERYQNLGTEVSVEFYTENGTSLAGQDYLATNGILRFASNEALKIFDVRILNNLLVQPVHTVHLVLTNVSANAMLREPSAALLSIADDDTSLSFDAPAFDIDEATNLVVNVTRAGLTNSTLMVSFAAVPGTAVPGVNFVRTNGSLVFNPGETVHSFLVQGIDDGVASGNKTVRLVLTNLIGEAAFAISNAVLTLHENDFLPGLLFFSSARYSVSELGGLATLTVLRSNGLTGDVSADFFTTPGTATPGVNYIPVQGTLTFAQGVASRTLVIPIRSNNIVEGLKDFTVTLSAPSGGASLTNPSVATVMIEDVHFAAGTPDPAFDPGLGADGYVRSVAVQPDGKILAGGAFSRVNGVLRNYLARLNRDGSLDTSFLALGQRTNFAARYTNNGVVLTNVILTNYIAPGPDALVASIRVQTNDSRIIIGGAFSWFTNLDLSATPVVWSTNQTKVASLGHVARLNTDGATDTNFVFITPFNAAVNAVAVQDWDSKILAVGGFSAPLSGVGRVYRNGSLDPSFDPAAGANGTVNAVAVQPNGQVVVGGAFTTMNGFDRSHVARLGANGVLDLNFDSLGVVDGVVYAVAVQADGRIVIGGAFTHVNGVARSHLARLNVNGSLDTSYFAGGAADGVVFALALQPDGKLLAGGDFTTLNGLSRNRYARLMADGSVDTAFEPGRGADATVFGIALAPDNRIVLGGNFTQVNGYPRRGIAVLLNDARPVIIDSGFAGGAWRLTVTSRILARDVLESSEDLKIWSPLSTNIASGTTLDLLDPRPRAPQRFYRVRSF